jgi:hypothetical protein
MRRCHPRFKSFLGVVGWSSSVLGLSQRLMIVTIIEWTIIKDEKMILGGCLLIINTSTLIIILLIY